MFKDRDEDRNCDEYGRRKCRVQLQYIVEDAGAKEDAEEGQDGMQVHLRSL
jgi:hypothetical protein